MALSPYPVTRKSMNRRVGGAAATRRGFWIAVGAVAVLIGGCNKAEPKGQVIAVANGEEITLAELNEEARARGLPIASDRAIRDTLIQDLVDRKLLAQQAVRKKLERRPEHLIAARRLNEILLAQELIAAAQSEAADPSQQEVNAFIKAHPRAFGQRVLVKVERIGFPRLSDPNLTRSVVSARSLDDIDRLLAKAGVARKRNIELWDSANLADAVTACLFSVKTGETALLPQPDGMAAVRVISVDPRPVPEAEQPGIARESMMRERTQQVLQRLVQRARSAARVDYQREFIPQRGSGTIQSK
jgi:EpsD family peptidyl-prolyl cis-trans isomerase